VTDEPVISLATRLDALIEELDQLSFDRLRAASAERTGRPAEDKRLTRARRAMEKASRLLKGEPEAPDAPA
jgi:hypothetical protein